MTCPCSTGQGNGSCCFTIVVMNCDRDLIPGAKVWLTTGTSGDTNPNNTGYAVTNHSGSATFCVTPGTIVNVHAEHESHYFPEMSLVWPDCA